MSALPIGEQPDAMPISATTDHARQADSLLTIYADALDDIERVRIANENRARALRQIKGLDGTREEARLIGIIDALRIIEHDCDLELRRALRDHPLWPAVKAMRGVGAKQGARLLASIGDPYWHSKLDRPRRVSELWAYCGLNVLHLDSQTPNSIQIPVAVGVDSSSTTDHANFEDQAPDVGGADSRDPTDQNDGEAHAQTVRGVAPSRRRGTKANWNTTAKMRAFLVAESCVKAGIRMLPGCEKDPPSTATRKAISGYGELYLARRDRTAEHVHAHTCVRCGPSGNPAQPRSPWSDGHKHADALRVLSKRILKDLWRESRDLHQAADD